jgi:hypothetical protein
MKLNEILDKLEASVKEVVDGEDFKKALESWENEAKEDESYSNKEKSLQLKETLGACLRSIYQAQNYIKPIEKEASEDTNDMRSSDMIGYAPLGPMSKELETEIKYRRNNKKEDSSKNNAENFAIIKILWENQDRLKELLKSSELEHALIELDSFTDSEISQRVENNILKAFDNIKDASTAAFNLIEDKLNPASITPDKVEELSQLATAFDESGDEFLMKQASVIDELLITLSAPKNSILEHKKIIDYEINKLRDAARSSARERAYEQVNKDLHDGENNVEAVQKAVAEQVDTRKPSENMLSSRHCPEHAGCPMARIGEDEWQCSLDKKVYNFREGYTTLKGNQVPGSSVQNQTDLYQNRADSHTIFDSRDSLMQNKASE